MSTILRHLWCCWCCKGPWFHSLFFWTILSLLYYRFFLFPMKYIHTDWLLCRHCVEELGLNLQLCPLALPWKVLSLLWGHGGLRDAGGNAAWKQILLCRCLQWSCCLTVEAVFLLHSKCFGMVSLLQFLLLLCQLLSTFLLCFYYKEMNPDFPGSEYSYCWHCRLQQVFRLIQAGSAQIISEERGFSWSGLGFSFIDNRLSSLHHFVEKPILGKLKSKTTSDPNKQIQVFPRGFGQHYRKSGFC